jgi:hypothetical protein
MAEMRTILWNMTGDNLRRLASVLISKTPLTDAENELAEWVMDDISARRKA